MDFLPEDDFNARFRGRLAATRKELNWTHEKMAQMLGVRRETYKKYEYRSAFPLYLLPRLIVVTEQPYSYWLFGQGRALTQITVIRNQA